MSTAWLRSFLIQSESAIVLFIYTHFTLNWTFRGMTLRLESRNAYRKEYCRRHMGQKVGMPGLGSKLSTYWQKRKCGQHTSAKQNSIPWVSVVSPGLKPNRRVWRAVRLGLSCKATKCSDAGTGDLGVLTAHETSPWFSPGDASSTQSGWMPPQVSK